MTDFRTKIFARLTGTQWAWAPGASPDRHLPRWRLRTRASTRSARFYAIFSHARGVSHCCYASLRMLVPPANVR